MDTFFAIGSFTGSSEAVPSDRDLQVELKRITHKDEIDIFIIFSLSKGQI